MCDRVIVLWDGRVSAEMPAAEADEQTLLQSMHGLVKAENLASAPSRRRPTCARACRAASGAT